MAGLKRYTRMTRLDKGRALSTSEASVIIYNMVENKKINVTQRILQEGERLDYLAGKYYGNAALWWVIAAASGIGWGLQVPPGTYIRIPTDISKIAAVIG